MTVLASTTDFTTGAVLSWALPLGIVVGVLLWWAAVLTVRGFKIRSEDSGPESRN